MNFTEQDIQRAIDIIKAGTITIEDISNVEFKVAVELILNPQQDEEA